MPIPVTCPGCLARFSVSDKYAGKQGPCPKCKQLITVPDKSQEVVIHAPEQEGPKDSTGRPVLKPLRRTDFNPTTLQIVIASVVAVASLAAALVGRFAYADVPIWGIALVVIGLAYPLASLGELFFRDDELGGYVGRERLVRIGICAVVFAATWGLFWFLSYYFGHKVLADIGSIELVVYLGVMFVIGTLVSLGACELEVGQSVLHYSMYFVPTLLLAVIAGVELGEPLARKVRSDFPEVVPAQTKPMNVNPPALPTNP